MNNKPLMGEKKVFYRGNINRKNVSLFVFSTFLQIPHGNNKIEAIVNSLDLVIKKIVIKDVAKCQLRAWLYPSKTLN